MASSSLSHGVKSLPLETGVISVMGGYSYDEIYTSSKYQTSNRKVFQITPEQILAVFNYLMIQNTPEMTHKLRDIPPYALAIRDIFLRIGADNMTLNFECCSDYSHQHNLFKTPELSQDANRFIVFMLEQGSQVICADYALKCLIGTWDPHIFGVECPFIQTGTTSGKTNVQFSINACKESVLPALCAVANMAAPDASNPDVSRIEMRAMHGTITYAVKRVVDPNLIIKVMSVSSIDSLVTPDEKIEGDVLTTISRFRKKPAASAASALPASAVSAPPGSAAISSNLEISTAHGTTIRGAPIHTEVYIKGIPGVLVVSSLHLVNLEQVNASSANIITTCSAVAGEEAASVMATQLYCAAKKGAESLAAMKTDCVRTVGAMSSVGYKPHRKPTGGEKKYASSPV